MCVIRLRSEQRTLLKFRVAIEMIMCVDVGLRCRVACILDVKAAAPPVSPSPRKEIPSS